MRTAALALLAVAAVAETRYSVGFTEEAGYAAGMRTPGARAGNLAMVQPRFHYRAGERWRFQTSLAGIASSRGDDTAFRLRVRETYLGATLGDVDLAAGKKVLRWSTGYAFTPTGVLDPPRNPADPTDRLGLTEGREMLSAGWVRGRHALTGAWAVRGRDTVAFRYNTLTAGFDTAVVLAHDPGRPIFTGANFTRVFGDAVEIHGEFARRDATAVLAGGKYTPRSGVNGIFEFYSPREPGGPRRYYGFLRVGKSRLRELPGWKEWNVAASCVLNLGDHSRMMVVDTSRGVRQRVSVYGRAQFPAGRMWRSEYGRIPYTALVTAGLRFQI
jgi:hypothetical protein